MRWTPYLIVLAIGVLCVADDESPPVEEVEPDLSQYDVKVVRAWALNQWRTNQKHKRKIAELEAHTEQLESKSEAKVLKAEIIQLKRLLRQYGHDFGNDATEDDANEPDYLTSSDMLSQIPLSLYPRGDEPWTPFQASRASEWLKDKFAGRRVRVLIDRFKISTIQNDLVRLDGYCNDFKSDRLYVASHNAMCFLLKDQNQDSMVTSLKTGAPFMVEGVIYGISVGRNRSWPERNRGIPDLTGGLAIKDCRLLPVPGEVTRALELEQRRKDLQAKRDKAARIRKQKAARRKNN